MADDIVTRLIVQNGREWVATLSEAAVAEQNLINVVSRAATLPPIQLASGLVNQIETLTKARSSTEQLAEALKLVGIDADEVTKKISNNTKALLANAEASAKAAEAASRHQIQISKISTALPTGSQTGLLADPITGVFAQGTRNFGSSPGNLPNIVAADARAQQARFLQDELRQKQIADEKILQFERLKQQRLNQIAQQAAEERRKITSNEVQNSLDARRRAAGIDFFSQRTGVISRQISGFDNAQFTGGLAGIKTATEGVTKASQDKNRAIDDQTQAEKRSSSGGITYLSTLSAIHAASFLATNRTFTLAGSLLTLGAAFSRMGLGASLIGVTFGGVLLAFNSITTAIERLQQAAIKGITGAVALGAALTVALSSAVISSGRLASSVETAFAEIVAFGEPTREQLSQVDEVISGLSRRFGESAQSVASSSSAFIRAGGDIEAALKGASEAVVLLQVASRGELVPANAARSVATITNAFVEFKDNAIGAVDIVVATAQKSALTFTEVTQAFQQAGPTAANLNIPLADLAATIAVLSNNGLRGTVAGTGLKQVILDLSNPSKQAAEKLKELNISLFDTEGKTRPLGDVFADLSAKLGPTAVATGQLTDAQRAQAIAAIFGARANLAASIIARTGKKDFDDMRAAIEATSAVDIVETLLAPTNAQIGILTENVNELSRAFGGPLNVAFGSVVKRANEFVQTIERGAFERAGQSLIAVAAGEGFQPIIDDLEELSQTEPRISAFFTNLLSSLLTVRNTVVSQFIPAILGVGESLGSAFARIDIENTFSGITRALVTVVSVGSRFATFMSDLITSISTGDERGQAFGSTLSGLVTVIATGFVGSLVAAAIPMVLAIKLLESIGNATLGVVKDLGKFNSLWEAGWQLAKDSVDNFLKGVFPELRAFSQFLLELPNILRGDQEAFARLGPSLEILDRLITGVNAPGNIGFQIQQAGSLDKAILNNVKNLEEVRSRLVQVNDEIEKSRQRGIAPPEALVQEQTRMVQLEAATSSLLQQLLDFKGNPLPAEIAAGSRAVNEYLKLVEELEATQIDLSSIFNFAEGDTPTFFSNLAKRVAEFQDQFTRRPEDDPTEPGFLPNPQGEAEIAKKIADIARDASQAVDNLIDDSQQKQADLIQDTLKKVIEAETQFNRQMAQIDQDIIDRKDDVLQQIADTRTDRAFNQVLQRFFEDADRQHDASNQRRDLREQQALASSERLIQRQLQDYNTFLGQRQQLDEQAFQRGQALEQRAFSRSQQDDQRNLSARQQREEEALQKSLDTQSRLRDDQRRLAEAKPEDRAQVQADINRATQDRQFQEGQQGQLKALRQRHERENVTFQRTQEDQAFAFRLRQQVAEFNFRIRLEQAFQEIKRNLEDREFGRTDNRDQSLLEKRISRSEFEALRRRAIQEGQQNLQDQFQDQVVTRRTFDRIDREAEKRRTTLGTNTILEIFNIIDRFEEQRQTQSEQRARTARGIQQRAAERATTLAEELGQRPSALESVIDRLNLRLTFTIGLLEQGQQEAQDFLNIIGAGTIQDITNTVPGSSRVRPSVGPSLPRSLQEQQPVSAPLQGSIRLILPPDFRQIIQQGVAQGVQTLPRQGPQINVGGNVYDPSDLLRLYQQYLLGQALQRR